MKKTNIKKTLSNKIKGICNGSSIRGITLISLVVTIVILLVLAGVVVNLSLGENGIISKAQTAVGKYENAVEQEKFNLAQIGSVIGNRDMVMVDKSEYDQLKNDVVTLKAEIQAMKSKNVVVEHFSNLTIPAKDSTNNTASFLVVKTVTFDHDCVIQTTGWVQTTGTSGGQVSAQLRVVRDNVATQQIWEGFPWSGSGAINVSSTFNVSAGDQLQFRLWNWGTSQQTIAGASLSYYEL